MLAVQRTSASFNEKLSTVIPRQTISMGHVRLEQGEWIPTSKEPGCFLVPITSVTSRN